ncbi:4626_t:CDS:2 [Rhizophagus irregularis]|nr:4626_t:CDS:2 [Rhizophagus irregularis]
MSNYPGQNVLISYLKERGNKSSYRGFLDNSSDIITTTISSADTVKNLDAIWFRHFLKEAKSLFNQETYVEIRNRFLQNFWQRIIKEYKKENLASAITLNRTSDIKSSEISQPDIKEYKKENLAPSVTSHLNKISGIKSSEILQSDRIIKEHKKENLAPDVTSHLNKTSDIKSSEISQSDSIKKGELKRVRDDNTDTESLSNGKLL